jgi:hypothetical protein
LKVLTAIENVVQAYPAGQQRQAKIGALLEAVRAASKGVGAADKASFEKALDKVLDDEQAQGT